MSEDGEDGVSSLLDEDIVSEKKPAHERRALPGEEIERMNVEGGWVKNYDKFMAKSELEKSRTRREQFKQKLVQFPYSWWDEITKRDEERVHLDGIVKDEIGRESYKHTWSVRDNSEHPALSQFPSKLVKQILMMWSWPNDKVFDPFAGHMTRPILTNHFNRDYWGCDVSREYFDRTKHKIKGRTEGGLLEDQLNEDSEHTIDVTLDGNYLRLENRDSRKLDQEVDEWRKPLPDDWANFILTSPPYWDLENYGPEDEQLGHANEEFLDFMEDMRDVLAHAYRILKDRHYAAFVVNDFRKDSMWTGLTDYHRYLIEAAEDVGFDLHDIALYPTGQSAGIFTMQLTHMEVTAKIHEYIIVFRKNEDNTRWQPRGLHLDCYDRDLIIDEYSEEYLHDWIEERRERDMNVDEWLPQPEPPFEGDRARRVR